ncbi:type II secretory pathway component PulM [Psychrobacter sp. PL19]|uniref:type II secretion system protein GspM n=1 Tax=Psychrobacter sp. PL19 TaxID=2760711 RepID=UPI001AE51E2C
MKILQRRAKPSPSTDSALSGHINHYQNLLRLRWQVLSPRDQLALGVLIVFLLLFVGGYGGYSMRQAAIDSKADYQEQVADYFWLRAQAGNIDSNALSAANTQSGDAPPASSISSLLNASGIDNAQVVAAGDAVQLSFSNASQAVVSAALGKLEQQGWQFTQLSMEQDPATKFVQVQAIVSS